MQHAPHFREFHPHKYTGEDMVNLCCCFSDADLDQDECRKQGEEPRIMYHLRDTLPECARFLPRTHKLARARPQCMSGVSQAMKVAHKPLTLSAGIVAMRRSVGIRSPSNANRSHVTGCCCCRCSPSDHRSAEYPSFARLPI